MKLLIIENCRARFQNLTQRQEEIRLENGELMLTRFLDQWKIRIIYGYDEQPFLLKMNQLFTLHSPDRDDVRIILIQDEIHERIFLPFRTHLMLDSHSPYISFSSSLLNNCRIELFSDGRIIFQDNDLIFLNETVIKESCMFKDGDVLHVLGSRIFLHHNFICVENNGSLQISDQNWMPSCDRQQLNQIPAQPKHLPMIYNPHEPLTLHLKFPPCPHLQDDFGLSHSFSSLFTTGASFSCALLMAFQYYSHGRSLIEILPMMILPAAMFLSILISRPVSARSFRKRNQKKSNEFEQECIKIIQNEKKLIERVKEERSICMNRYFPSQDSPDLIIEREHYVRIGMSQQQVVLFPDTEIHVFNKERRKEFEKELNNMASPLLLPVIIHLDDYHTVHINGPHAEKLMHQICIRLLNGTASAACPVAVNVDFSFVDSILYSHQLFTSEGKRRILSAESDIDVKGCIVFLKEDDHYDTSEASCIIQHSSSPDCDLYIEEENDSVFHAWDLKNRKKFKFISDPEEVMLTEKEWLPECIQRKNDFFSLHHIDDIQRIPLQEIWNENSLNCNLCASLGKSSSGHTIHLDLSDQEDGPHGLVAGMTGSGKTVLLMTFLLSLAFNYSPEKVNFVLIDFKGGGCAQRLKRGSVMIPHIAGTLCNLDLDEMDRALIALKNECTKREELFLKLHSESGNVISDLREYRHIVSQYPSFPILPDLVIVIDEFAELKSTRPDFMNDLISIARIGRSLGLHLILSTQKPGGVVNDQIWANTNFKICMRTADRQDSMEILHRDDAFHLHSAGEFCLLKGGQTMEKGKCAFPYGPAEGSDICIFSDTMNCISSGVSSDTPLQADEVIDCILMYGKNGYHARKLWQEPIRELRWHMFRKVSGCPIGIIDNIHDSSYELLKIRSASILAITRQRQEKENFLKTVICSLLRPSSLWTDVVIIDDLRLCFLQALPDTCQVSLMNREQSVSFARKLNAFEKKDTMMIITDFPSFLEYAEEDGFHMEKYLTYPEEYGIRFILIAADAASVPYRYFTRIPVKLALQSSNRQDISTVLERNVRRHSIPAGHGMINNIHADTFRFITTTDDEFRIASAKTNQ